MAHFRAAQPVGRIAQGGCSGLEFTLQKHELRHVLFVLDVTAQAHALMQYAHDADTVHLDAVDDDMRADQVGKESSWQIVAAWPSCAFWPSALKASLILSR